MNLRQLLASVLRSIGRGLLWFARKLRDVAVVVGRALRRVTAEHLGLAAAIIAIAVSVWATQQTNAVAEKLDRDSAVRDRAVACRTAIVSMHEKLMTLRRGYSLDRSDKPQRLADWDDAADAVQVLAGPTSVTAAESTPEPVAAGV